ncbi:MAG: TonB-dependent receptor [Gammaproteobacteria bacterium]|nr:TonB-dependent receptor [Gammaproteobacteria bacterium]
MNLNIPFLCLLLIPISLLAENTNNTLSMLGTEEMYLDDMPVIISATRLSQPLNESPVSTTVIDRQMIDASGAQNIPDILRLVPGFTVGYLNGNSPVATYHGHSDRQSSRIQLVIDGRSVYLPTLAGVSWSDLIVTTDDIERIEVTRGPNASTYGNNSFLAVVSITTKHASEEQGQYIKSTVGAHDTADVFYRFGGQSEDLDYRVSLGTKNNSGTDLLNDFTETDYLSYRLDYQINLSTQLYYSGGAQDSTYGDVLEFVADMDNDFDVTTAFQHIRLEHNFENETSLSVQYYYNKTNSFESSLLGTFDGSAYGLDSFDVYDTFDLMSERHDLEAAYYYQPLESLRLVSGSSVRLDKVGANNVFDADADNSLLLYRVFTHGEFSFTDDWLLNAGLMIEDNDISGTDVAPRLALIHHLTDNHTFRLGASQATRTPTIFDESAYVAFEQVLTRNNGQPLAPNDPIIAILGSDQLIDVEIFSPGNVDSEEITSFEFGWMMNFLNNELVIDFKFFKDETNSLISEIKQLDNIPGENIGNVNPEGAGASYFGNTAKTDTQGFEAYSDYQISPDLRLYAYYAYVEITAEITNTDILESDQSRIVGRLEESTPRQSFGAMIMKQWPNNLNTSLSIYHVQDMDWLDRTSSRGATVNDYRDRSAENYTKIDLVIRKSHKTADGRIDFSLIVQNLGGTHFDYTQTSFNDPARQEVLVPGSEQDRRGYFELAFKFN